MGTSPSEQPRIAIRGAMEVDAATTAAIVAVVATLQARRASHGDDDLRPWAMHARETAVSRR